MPTQLVESNNQHPTPAQYRRLVWRKAREIEAGKWVSSVGTTILPLVGGITCVALIFGDPEIARDNTIKLAIVGCSLLLLGTWNLWRCLTSAPYRLHCDQVDRYEAYRKEAAADIASMRTEATSLTAERDNAMKIAQERPISIARARELLERFIGWLRTQGDGNPRDITEHGSRYIEFMLGFFREHATWKTEGATQERLGDFLKVRADQLQSRLNYLRAEDYEHYWKLPEWLVEIAPE